MNASAQTLKKVTVAQARTPAGAALLRTLTSARMKRDDAVMRAAGAIINDVRERGDAALFEYTKKFDGVKLTPATMRVSRSELVAAGQNAPPQFCRAMRQMEKRLKRYHSQQRLAEYECKTSDGHLRQIVKPLRRVALYIPGGHTVYPSSVLMCLIPAMIAGVKEIVAVTPPRGEIDPGVAFALTSIFQNPISEVYRIGGAQAVAALAYGTQTIAPVDKIVGPGNAYVAAAKRLVFGAVDIDCVAGPSEVVIVADKAAPPRYIALDLLAQAEHGSGDELAVLITESKWLARRVADEVEKEIANSPMKNVFRKLPRHAISVLVTVTRKESMKIANEIAPEHLQIMTASPEEDLALVENAGAVFLGANTPVALGDYFIGTNHVLPTGGAARYASPLGVESFQKRISVAEARLDKFEAAAECVPTLARAEAFEYHARSVEARGVINAKSLDKRRADNYILKRSSARKTRR